MECETIGSMIQSANAMDFAKTKFYRTLKKCDGNDDDVREAFDLAMKACIDERTLNAFLCRVSKAFRVSELIKAARMYDFLQEPWDVPLARDIIDTMRCLSEDEVTGIIDEFGKNEIVHAIKQYRVLKAEGASQTLRELIYQHGVDVEVNEGDTFVNPTKASIRISYTIPESWTNITRMWSYYTTTINHELPKLETLVTTTVIINAPLPNLKYLREANHMGHPPINSEYLPNLVYFLSHADVTAPLMSVLVSWRDEESVAPNCKYFDRSRQHSPNPNTICTRDGFIHPTETDCHLKGNVDVSKFTRFLDCTVNLTGMDERQLEFYDCSFRKDGVFLSSTKAQELLPNSLILRTDSIIAFNY